MVSTSSSRASSVSAVETLGAAEMPRRARVVWERFLDGVDPVAGLGELDHDRLYRFAAAMFLGHTRPDLEVLQQDLDARDFTTDQQSEILAVLARSPRMLADFEIIRGF